MFVLDFEKNLFELKEKLEKLLSSSDIDKNSKQIKKLRQDIDKKQINLYKNLDAWRKTQIARHISRPGTKEFIKHCTTDFFELQGDRHISNDPSIMCGFAKLGEQNFMIIGHVKGTNTTENIKINFGMPHPEGYRKAVRLMDLASRFNVPILTLIDTPGAYPGIEAEERQQSLAIAQCLQNMSNLSVPVISVVLGEGGSGGALALSCANRLLMLEHAIFGVISPEGCAAILWDDYSKVERAAKILKYTAQDLKGFDIIDEIIEEPADCAHNSPILALGSVKSYVLKHYEELKSMSPSLLIQERYSKFRKIGKYKE